MTPTQDNNQEGAKKLEAPINEQERMVSNPICNNRTYDN